MKNPAIRTILIILLCSYPIFSLPTPPSLEELIADSDYVARVKLSKIREKKLSKSEISVTCQGEVLEAYKTPAPMPAKLDIAFMVLPEIYGKWLKTTPKEGDYILFFVNKVVRDASGNLNNVIALYEPHPFAIYDYSKDTEKKIRKAMK